MKNFCSHISELTETSENYAPATNPTPPLSASAVNHPASPRGWILYDGNCRFCITAAQRFHPMFTRLGFVFLPLQTPWVQQRLGLIPGAPLEEMRVLTTTGDDYGGADAVLFLVKQIWWLRPVAWVGRLPGMHRIIDASYRWIAERRGCTHLKCAHESSGARVIPWAALIVLPTAGVFARPYLEPWAFMWLMVGAIFMGCKWLTLQQAKQKQRVTISRQLAYLFLWPGMDAVSFLGRREGRTPPSPEAWPNVIAALERIALGALLLWGIARHFTNDLLAGWTGMIGIILITHFGIFGLTAACWQLAGIPARPIMNAPWKAARISEFWGRRWNRAFQQLVIDTLFRRLAGSLGIVRATLVTFFISGLLHELVISLPAGAGYGLPTAYFLLQGWGIIAQRTPMAGRLYFSHGASGRIFTLFIVVLPAFGLFHPPFVRGVILPFMHAIGAL